jgi:anti-sigma factor RsiW
MSNHLTDADLVALVLLPDDAPDARLHLAACSECAARIDRVTNEVTRHREEHADSVEAHDATFWKRQELAIMRDVARASRRTAPRRGFVAAAILAVALGSFWFGRVSVDEIAGNPVEVATSTAPSLPDVQSSLPAMVVPATVVTTDPWENESLEEFQAVVDWESWIEDDGKDQGTI